MTDSAITRRKLRKAAHESSLEALSDLRRTKYPFLSTPVATIDLTKQSQPITEKDLRKPQITLSAPSDVPRARRRTAGEAIKHGGFVTIRKVWDVVVLTFDLVAEVFKVAGKVLAIYLTPEIWALANIGFAGIRGVAHTWQFLRPKSDIPMGLLNFARPITLLEVYSSNLMAFMPIYLLPSWLFQPITGYRAHDVRKMESYAEMFRADPDSMWVKSYAERLDAQLEEARKANLKDETQRKAAEVLSPTRATSDARAAELKADGWTQVVPKVELSREMFTRMAEGKMTEEEYARAFGHLNAEEIRLDDYDRYWAKPHKGKALFGEEPVVAAPTQTTSERERVRRTVDDVFAELDRDSEAWDTFAEPKRSRCYGVQRALSAYASDKRVVDGRKYERTREALKKEVLPRTSGFRTEPVMRGFDGALRTLRMASIDHPKAA